MKNVIIFFLPIFIISCTSSESNITKKTSQNGIYFGNYECKQDCSGHKAGYDWAMKKGIDTLDDCGGKSQSFIEGCYQYVEGNH